ncbi:MAG: UDP-N-acetylmuramate--L-alanine ligase [Gemmatimonadetes bacterium]|nr:UDP-N-acetylmuramate--L-alanine ligase [Gemmatimonadota bacterium]
MSRLNLVELARGRTVHFMGIGGAGMTPLADMLMRAGVRVTGCDAHPSAGAHALAKAGAQVADGHDPAHVAECAAVVVTAAVPASHPELEAARARGIPVLKRAEALGGIVNRGLVVGIAGTHGKTTTTTLTTAVLAAAGMQPTGFVGARVAAWGGNLHPGSDRLYVVEADEYDRSFLTLHPTLAVVTTLEADHLDVYGTVEAIEEAFAEFAGRVPADGMVACCADDAGAMRLLSRLDGGNGRRLVTYGTAEGAAYRAVDVEPDGHGSTFGVVERGEHLGRARIEVPGMHNVRNALAAVSVGRRLGAEWDAVVAGLASYTGIDRRFQRVGEGGGVLVVDDYAHHPTEVEATLHAARASHPQRRVVAVFQPHLYSRTRDFAAQFGRALALADRVFVTDVYAAREASIEGVTGQMIADAARDAGADVEYVRDRAEIVGRVAPELREGDLCITLGAGNLDAAARELVALVQGRTAEAAR